MKTKTPRLWLANTSYYHDHEAFILCRTALESIENSLSAGEVLKPIKVKLTNSSHAYAGRAYWTEWEHPSGPGVRHCFGTDMAGRTMRFRSATSVEWRRILVRIGPPSRFPRKVSYGRYKDMPEYEFKTYREAMVGVTAHEMGHAIDLGLNKPGELRCEMCCLDALDYYRKNQAEIDREIDEAMRAVEQKEQDALKARMPQQKAYKRLEQAKKALVKWQRKAKLAATKLKYYQRLVVRREREFNRASHQDFHLMRYPDATPIEQIALVEQVNSRRDAIEENEDMKLAATPAPAEGLWDALRADDHNNP